MDSERQQTLSAVGLLILRLGIGGYFLTHGIGKLEMLKKAQFAMFGDPIGIGPTASLILVVFAELVCSILVMAGLATRLAAIPPVIAMGVAAFVAHGKDPWTMQEAAMRFFSGASQSWASKQPALMFLVVFLTLVFTGGGRFSLDAVIAGWRSRRQASR